MSCNALCGTPSRRSRSMSTRWSPRPESRPPLSSLPSRTWKCAAWFSKGRGWCFRLRDCGFRIADWKGGRRIRNPQSAIRIDVEVTLEANPEDVTPDNARAWRESGVNRVSLGAQSFDDRVLKWMHRPHDAARIGHAVRALRAAGIDNISLDLIFALPAELERDWARDLDLACSLLPAHLSLYGLTVEERTPLARWVSRGATSVPNDDRYAEEYLLAHRRLAARGYAFYEVSNAARDGHRSRHNSAYWSGRAYVGLGPAPHSL